MINDFVIHVLTELIFLPISRVFGALPLKLKNIPSCKLNDTVSVNCVNCLAAVNISFTLFVNIS